MRALGRRIARIRSWQLVCGLRLPLRGTAKLPIKRELQRFGRRHQLAAGLILVGLILTLSVTGCGTAKISSSNAPLPAVDALSNPQLPDWIEQISPLREAAPTAQIRLRFKESLIPVESLENPDQQALLKKFELLPPLPGQFRFLTPRMVGFQADQAIPKATRVRVTLKAGLADLKQHRLDRDLAWTFNTEPIKLSNLPGSPPAGSSGSEVSEPFDLKPVLKVTSNAELDLESFKNTVKLAPDGEKNGLPLKVDLEKPNDDPETASPEQQFDDSAKEWTYTIAPQGSLNKATRYRLEIAAGLRPAKGNLLSEAAFTSQIATYAPLAFEKIIPVGQPDAGGSYGRFRNGSPQLQFNNILDAESAASQISISPAPKKDVPLVQVYPGERIANLNPWAIEPATTYTITLAADLKDKFGQALGKPVTVQYTTGDVSPDLWAPTGFHIFPTGKDLQLNLSTVNLPSYKSAFAVVQPTDLVYTDSAYPRDNGAGLLPEPARWNSARIKSKKNQSIDVPVPLQKQLGGNTGMLAYGVQARANSYLEGKQQRWRQPTIYGMVQLTNLGVFAQWFPDSGLVRVHHLADGSAANATVEIYQSKLEATERLPVSACATGKTDKTGTLLLDRAQMQPCLNPNRADPPKLLVVAREGKDWAFTRTLEYSGAYEYGVDAGWQSDKPESRGVIFSDRQLYQPGETAWFTGAAYYLQNGSLQQDKNTRYTVTLSGPDGQKKSLGTQGTNQFGTFSFELPIDKTQPLGYYTLQAKSDKGVEISGEFRVAEFKPPNFKVELDLEGGKPLEQDNPPHSLITSTDQTITAKTQSNYLFGPAVEGGTAKYYVTRQQTEFIPKGWDGYSFGRKWFWPEEAPTVPTDVLQTSQAIASNGQSSQTVKVEKDLPYPMSYRVDAEVTDVSNLSVSDSQSFLALPSDRLIGLQSDFVAEAEKPFPIKVIVTDPQGKADLNQKVHLELQQMNYSRIGRLVEGSRTDQNQVEYKTVATTDVRSDVNFTTASLTPPASGSYRIRATFAGTNSDASATDMQIWATGKSAANWGDRYTNNRLEIKLDKPNYRLGEIATALIQSPYEDAELYFAVVRHNVLYKTTTRVNGSAPRIQFQVTPDMLPNAAVEAVLVRQGKPIAQTEPGSLDSLTRIGFAPFTTNLDTQYLKVEATATPSRSPGEQQTVQLTLKNAQEQPTKGQFTVMVVNEAVLQLSGYRPPDLVKTVYAEQPISTRLGDNRPDVVLQPQASPLQKGWGYGGGFSTGAGNTRMRTDFRPLAYYSGSILTDASGKASVTFKLPDDLTTWRVMAVATDGDLHFGNGETTFITTKPLIANPLLPQFARPGDRLQIGVAITNNTGQQGNLAINSAVTDPLKLDNSPGSLQTQVESGTHAYRFPVVAQATGKSTVQFTAQLNNATDAFEFPLELKPLEVTEQVVETGTTTNQATIPLNVDANVTPDVGGLDISLASTLIPTIVAPTQQVLNDNDLPFLEPAASRLTIAATLQSLSKTYGQTFADFNPPQQAVRAIGQLQTLQKSDGGFAAYPGQEKSDPFVTPYAAQALARAMQVFGEDTPQSGSSLLPSLTSYLKQLLADPGRYDFCKDQRCKNQVRLETLIALAELGEKRNDFLSDLYEQRSQFDPVSQLKLARYLAQFPEWQSEAKAMATQLQETVYQTGRSATVNLPQTWRWLNSPTTAQAQALRLFMTQNSQPDVLDRLLQGLLSKRRNGTWQTAHDTAEALTALVEYSKRQPTPPSFTATAQLAGKTLASTKFEGYRNPNTHATVGMAALPRSRHDLILKKSGRGTLHYQVAYRYRLQGNQPGQLNGLRVTRQIRPANQEKILFKTGLYAAEPLTLPVGQVLDVGIEVITDHAVDHVVITDPLPAGFEAVDATFQTSTPYFQAQGDSWQLGYQTIHADRVVAYGDRLEPGVYTLHYLVRSVTPGTFLYPGADAHLQYAPEEFGRSASSTLVVKE